MFLFVKYEHADLYLQTESAAYTTISINTEGHDVMGMRIIKNKSFVVSLTGKIRTGSSGRYRQRRKDSVGMWSFVVELINDLPRQTTAGALGIMIQGRVCVCVCVCMWGVVFGELRGGNRGVICVICVRCVYVMGLKMDIKVVCSCAPFCLMHSEPFLC